jgi:energy-coupling factor transporter ATP-binding protein EcfA2
MVGIVFQNAETQILCATVAEEIARPENLASLRRRFLFGSNSPWLMLN